jgi:hypothetical protein
MLNEIFGLASGNQSRRIFNIESSRILMMTSLSDNGAPSEMFQARFTVGSASHTHNATPKS